MGDAEEQRFHFPLELPTGQTYRGDHVELYISALLSSNLILTTSHRKPTLTAPVSKTYTHIQDRNTNSDVECRCVSQTIPSPSQGDDNPFASGSAHATRQTHLCGTVTTTCG